MVQVDKGEFLQPNTISPKVFKFLQELSEDVPAHERVVILTFNEFPFSYFARMTPDGYNNGEKLPSHVLIPCIRFVYDRTFHFLGSLFFYSDYMEKDIDKFSKDISECMKLYILALKRVSLTVIATVAPMTDTFYGALKNLCYIPYFHEFYGALCYYVEEMCIVHIHDPTHVENRFVKLFLENDIEFIVDNIPYIASKADIVECLKIYKKPLISRNPEEDAFEQTNSIGQYYLSYDVIESMDRLLKLEILPPKAKGTALFIRIFLEIFEELFTNSDDAKFLILNDSAMNDLINFVQSLRASEKKKTSGVSSQSSKREQPKSSKIVRNLKDIDSHLTKQQSDKAEKRENAKFKEMAKKLEHDIYSEMCNTPDFIENNPDVVITTASGKTLSATPTGGTKKSRKKKNAPIPPDVRKELIRARIAAAEASKVTTSTKKKEVAKTKTPTTPKEELQQCSNELTPSSKAMGKKHKNTEPPMEVASREKIKSEPQNKCDDKESNQKNSQNCEKGLASKCKRRKKSKSESLNTSQSSFDTSLSSITEDQMKRPTITGVQSQNKAIVRKISFADDKPSECKSKLTEKATKKLDVKADVDGIKRTVTKNKRNEEKLVDDENIMCKTSFESSINPKKRKKSNNEHSGMLEGIDFSEALVQFGTQAGTEAESNLMTSSFESTNVRNIEVPNLIDYELQIERLNEIERTRNVEDSFEIEEFGGGIPLTVEEFESTLLEVQGTDHAEGLKTNISSTEFESTANINDNEQVGICDTAVNFKPSSSEPTNKENRTICVRNEGETPEFSMMLVVPDGHKDSGDVSDLVEISKPILSEIELCHEHGSTVDTDDANGIKSSESTASKEEIKNESEVSSDKKTRERVDTDRKSEIDHQSKITDNNDDNEADKISESLKYSQGNDNCGRLGAGNDWGDTDEIPDLIEDSEPIEPKIEDMSKNKGIAINDIEIDELPELVEDFEPIVSEMEEKNIADCVNVKKKEVPDQIESLGTSIYERALNECMMNWNKICSGKNIVSQDVVQTQNSNQNKIENIQLTASSKNDYNEPKSEGSQLIENVQLTEEFLKPESKDLVVNKTERKYLSPIKNTDNIISPSSAAKKKNKSHEDVMKSIHNEDGSDKENTDVNETISPTVVNVIEEFAEKLVSAQVDAEAIRGITLSISSASQNYQNKQEFESVSALEEINNTKPDNAEVFVTTDLISEESMDLLVQNYLSSDQYQQILGSEAKIDTSSKFDAVVDCFRKNYEILKSSILEDKNKKEEPPKKEESLIRIRWKDDQTVSIEKVRADSVKLPLRDAFRITDLREIENKTLVENSKSLRRDDESESSTKTSDCPPKVPIDQNFGKSSVNEQVKSFIESFNKNDIPGSNDSTNERPPENAVKTGAIKKTHKKVTEFSAKDIEDIKNWDNFHQFVNIMNTFLKSIVQFCPVLHSTTEIMERIREDCLKVFIARRGSPDKILNDLNEVDNPYNPLFFTYINKQSYNERVKCEVDAIIQLLDPLVIDEITYDPDLEIIRLESKLVRNLWLNNAIGIRKIFEYLRNFDIYDELAPDLFKTDHVVKIMKHILQKGNDPYSFDFNYDCTPIDIRECFNTLKPHGSVLLVE